VNTVAERLQTATANLTPPFAVVDLEALDSNAESMITRANGLPIRLATKSIRCRTIADRVLRRAALRQAQGRYSQGGFQGVLAYSLAEAIWLATRESRMSCWPIRPLIPTHLLILLMMIS
jgi:D-serine deaminase-like pyridoxal phosphate-dependent protein